MSDPIPLACVGCLNASRTTLKCALLDYSRQDSTKKATAARKWRANPEGTCPSKAAA